MTVSYSTQVLFEGNHASLQIPDAVLAQLDANRRAPLKVTVNGHTYQSTATGVDGQCRVVFPQRDRDAAGVNSPGRVEVTLELDAGHRETPVPASLEQALSETGLRATFDAQSYSQRRIQARSVADAKTESTALKRIERIVMSLSSPN
jgi:bifunctional DNA-binding transcriptional regulator/antitoxin component of YhaV-PrlF toxin-antitoxin module